MHRLLEHTLAVASRVVAVLAVVSCGSRTPMSTDTDAAPPDGPLLMPCQWTVGSIAWISVELDRRLCTLAAAVDDEHGEAVVAWSDCASPATHGAAIVTLGEPPSVTTTIETAERVWDISWRQDRWVFAETSAIVMRDRALAEVESRPHPLEPALTLDEADPGVLLGLDGDQWLAWSIDRETVIGGPFGASGWWAELVPGHGWIGVSSRELLRQPIGGSERTQSLPKEVMKVSLTDDPVTPGLIVGAWPSMPTLETGFCVLRASVEGRGVEQLATTGMGPTSNLATTDSEALITGWVSAWEQTLWSIPLDGSATRTIDVPEPSLADEVLVVTDRSTAAMVGRRFEGGIWIRQLLCSR